MIDPKLKDKVVLITGANHGIGAGTAKALAIQGARIFITYYITDSPFSTDELQEARENGIGGLPLYFALQQQSGEVVASEIRRQGGIVAVKEADLGDVTNIPILFDACEEKIGPVDILINNHTYDVFDTFDPELVEKNDFGIHLINTDNIDRHLAVNARACALLMEEYLQRYISRGAQSGRIINLTTVLAHERNVSYAASKHALVSYSMSAAKEIGKYGITVNVVCPGATQTGYITPENEEQITNWTPLKRVGYPEDVADVIVFLASEQAHWVTGQLIYASGGFLMYMHE